MVSEELVRLRERRKRCVGWHMGSQILEQRYRNELVQRKKGLKVGNS